ncbi:hypothetical protein ACNPQM_11365 [Streptomyces sp. NPDC056231]|uniref:hypothetical protein n=1 Tax=Streptomyces sp. NPDC056231 TaxID=3345755 RepID=UPI003AADD923
MATATVAVSAVICAATPTARSDDTAQAVHPSGLGPAGPGFRLPAGPGFRLPAGPGFRLPGGPGNGAPAPGVHEIARPTSIGATPR